MDDDLASVQAPTKPPSFLSESQLYALCTQGHLAVSLPDHLNQGATAYFAASKDFFDLPLDVKKSLYPTAKDSLEHGYHHIESEKEFLTLRYRSITASPPLVEKQLTELWHDLAHFLYRVLIDVGDYIDVPEVAWRTLAENSMTLPETKADTPSLLRTFRYEPLSGVADPHNDLGLLTVCICMGRGLQVWQSAESNGSMTTRSEDESIQPKKGNEATNHWKDAGEVTILVGDTLRILSAGRVRSGRHRVVANSNGRSSIIFALRPSLHSAIDLALFGGEGQVDSKLLWSKIKGNRVNVNAQKDVRVQQRQKRKDVIHSKIPPLKQAEGS